MNELIVSELSANAILHTASGQTSGSFHLAPAVSPQVIALSVTDDGGTGTAPKVEDQDQEGEHGRGLGMVSVLAHRVVVVHSSQSGHAVTAEPFTDTRRGAHPRLLV
ncbi:ATP-binding protein [Streptomyces sp. NPDC052043]|uniref:ATP-binding protein n=1 Tax=Streptomyces sp. NPDC052043 TaxID=3365684 RepID=UPI0037D6366E